MTGGPWRMLLEGLDEAVLVVDAAGDVLFANRAAEELCGPGWPGTDPTLEPILAGLGPSGTTRSRSVVTRPDGTEVAVEVVATAVEFDEEPAVRLEVRDMTGSLAAERRWRNLFEGSPVAIVVTERPGPILRANQAFVSFLGRTDPAEVIGHDINEFLHPDEPRLHRSRGRRIAAAPDGVVQLEIRFVRPDGEVRWGWATSGRTFGPQGEPWTISHVEDVTVRRMTQLANAESQANMAAVADVVRQIQLGADARRSIVQAAKVIVDGARAFVVEPTTDGKGLVVTATTDPEYQGRRVAFDSTFLAAKAFLHDAPAFEDGDPARYAFPVRSTEGVIAVIGVSWAGPIFSLDDRRADAIGLLADQAGVAFHQEALVHELESLALTDPLTGLPNRRGWDQDLPGFLGRADRADRPLTVAVVDLDRFKLYNDAHGHPAGDRLLREFSVQAHQLLRGGDVMARWGGEEFAIALPHCPGPEAEAVLGRILLAVPWQQTCSIGYATWDGEESADELMVRTDRALYAAKRDGRNRIVAATP